jgi:hypothetical protein
VEQQQQGLDSAMSPNHGSNNFVSHSGNEQERGLEMSINVKPQPHQSSLGPPTLPPVGVGIETGEVSQFGFTSQGGQKPLLSLTNSQAPILNPSLKKQSPHQSVVAPVIEVVQDGPVVAAQESALHAGKGGSGDCLKLGSHSVNINNVTDKLLFDMSDVQQATPNFNSMYSNVINEGTADIIDQDNSIIMRSFMCRSAAGGGNAIPVPVTGRVFPYHIGRVAAHNRQTLNVELLPGLYTGMLEKSALKRLYNAGVPNERAVTSALQPILRVGNAALLRGICGAISKNWDVYDN